MGSPGIANSLLGHKVVKRVWTPVKDHGLMGSVGVDADGQGPQHLTICLVDFNGLSNVLGRRWGPIRQQVRHRELHIHLKLVGLGKGIVIHGRESVPLASIAVIVGVVPHNLVPRTLQTLRVESENGGSRGPWFIPKLVRPSWQYRNLDAFVVFYGTLEQIVKITVSIPCHASRDAGVIS
jgi:hypothetical protein